MNLQLSHIAIAVTNVERAAARLQAAYGMTAGACHVNEAQGVRMAYVELAGGGRLELIEPLTENSGVGRFLKKNPGGGVHHLSFAVPDMDAALEGLAAKSVGVLGDGAGRNVHGDRIAFIHPRDFLGVLVELEEPNPAHG